MKKLHGCITALAVPFKDDKIDERTYEQLCDWQVREGVHGVVVNGTTGEAPTLTEAEQDRLLEVAIKVIAGRVPVIAGTGNNETAHVMVRTGAAEKLGADAALVVTPYYNKPTQEGLYQHFKAIHDANQISIIAYNIPPRCIVDILPATMKKIAALPRVIGVKDATGDCGRPVRTRNDCGRDFLQFCGDDALALPFLVQGAVGCISVASNLAPRLCVELQNAWTKGDIKRAQEIGDALQPLTTALFAETSPQPLKYGLSLMGFGSDAVRLPLVACSAEVRKHMHAAMDELGLLQAKAA